MPLEWRKQSENRWVAVNGDLAFAICQQAAEEFDVQMYVDGSEETINFARTSKSIISAKQRCNALVHIFHVIEMREVNKLVKGNG